MHFQLAGSGVMSAFYPHESELSRRVKQLIRAAKKQLEALSVPAAMEMDDDFDSAFEHGKAVGWNACRAAMLQSQGNCIKDGWISCSDRMPEDTKMLLAFSQGEIVAAYWNWVVNPIDYKKYRAFTYLSGNILDDVTHWMPLPEPPL